jgi:hypothetical protein
LLHLQDAVRYVFIADSDVADVQVEREQPRFIYVTAKKPGITVLYVVDSAGHVLLNKDIEVSPPPAQIPPVAIIRSGKLEYQKLDTQKPEPPPQPPVVPLQTAPPTPPEIP